MTPELYRAAPELFRALEELLNAFDDVRDEFEDDSQQAKAWNRACDALKAARGLDT